MTGRRRAERARLRRAGARGRARCAAQNVIGSLDRDLLVDRRPLGGPFTPVGFYYRTMIRPRRLWPLYEKVLRNVAGLGRVDEHASRTSALRHRAPPRRRARRSAAGEPGSRRPRRAARRGERVVLVDESVAAFERRAATRCSRRRARSAIYEGGLVPVDAGNVLLPLPRRADRRRDRRARAAARLPRQRPRRRDAARRRCGGSSTTGRSGRASARSSSPQTTAALAVADAARARRRRGRRRRRPARARAAALAARGRRGRLAPVDVDGEPVDCDLLVDVRRPPARVLAARAGGRARRVRRRARRSSSRRDLPAGRRGGRVASRASSAPAVPRAAPRRRRRATCFVCVCEDVDVEGPRSARSPRASTRSSSPSATRR